MVAASQVMLEVGLIMLLGFIGAGLATRAKQSVIIGYILVGILIGPFISFQILGFQYDGLIQDTTFIDYMSKIGLTLLMFFVGLEFSISKLKKTKSPALVLALVNTGIDMFMGILLGLALGWPIIDTIFLAGVVAMGSAAVTGKSLMELQKFSNPETEFLLGMVVVEDFISMVLLTIVGGLVIGNGGVGLGSSNLAGMLVGIIAFYAFFIVIAIWVIPKTAVYFTKIKNDELFVLFALGMVFTAGALAEACGVPSIIGAFFLGMVFAETKLADRFSTKLGPFRDAFVAIFFVFFGMLIDPAMFGSVITIVLLAVPLVLIGDLLFTGALAYLLGFSGRAATSMGASMCGRGAESIMYASVGSNAVGVTKGALLNPFAGLFCFILSVLTPILMRFSDAIYKGISHILPGYVKHSSSVMSRTMSKLVLPNSLKLFQRGRRIEAGLIAYFILMLAVALTTGYIHIALFLATLGLTIWTLYMFDEELQPVVRSVNYDNLGLFRNDGRQISAFISSIMFISLLAALLVSFFFQYMWWSSMVIILGYMVTLLLVMNKYSKRFKMNISTRSKKRHKEIWNFDATEPVVPHLASDEAGISGLETTGLSKRMHSNKETKAKGKWKYL
jgi:CPA2 family monovalent cation:H+ antiporter-2